MKFKVGDKVKVRIDLVPYEVYGGLTFFNNHMSKCKGQICTIKEITINNRYRVNENLFVWSEEMLKPVAPTLAEIKDKKLTCVIHTPNREDAMCVVSKIPSSKSHTTSDEWLGYWDRYKENTCYNIIDGGIDAYGSKQYYGEIYEFSDLFATGGVLPTTELIKKEFNVTWIDKIALPTATETKEMTERVKREILKITNAFSNDGISAKNGGKNTMKFTFYVTEGTRPDKKPDGDGKGVIPTMTTTVANGFDEVSVTCDKADYNERQGVLEAIAQLYCKGRFDKEYEAAVKINKRKDRANRTCYYCGKVFDTVEEREEHEDWHVERRKARHERYLLRKRAKEIAFEEQAQKMAREIIAENKKEAK